MKKFLCISLILFTSLCYTQINLQYTHVENSNAGNQGTLGYFSVIKSQQGTFYYTRVYMNSMLKINIYDQNYNFYKTFSIAWGASIHFITDKLFNNDNLIEFLYVEGIHTKLVNEDGVLLYTWSDRWDPKIFIDENNNYKLIVYNKVISAPPFPTTSDIYALGGTLSQSQQDLYLDKSFREYPNPTDDTITISNGKFLLEDTKLEVFDSKGNKIYEKEIMSGERDIIFDTSSYSSGTYIYTINDETRKFIKK